MNSTRENSKILCCSNCFSCFGLIKEMEKFGQLDNNICPNCGENDGFKLDENNLVDATLSYFVLGTFHKTEYGGSNVIAMNEYHFGKDEVIFPEWISSDAMLIGNLLKVGFFYYAPQMWRVGETEAFNELSDTETRGDRALSIVDSASETIISPGKVLYRVRKDIESGKENEIDQYDSPPEKFKAAGRIGDGSYPVFYASDDLEICLHETRVAIIDKCYIAILRVGQEIKCIDFTKRLSQKDVYTPFDDLNIVISQLFDAEEHSYPIINAISNQIRYNGYDGIIYPSYYGQIKNKQIPNIALFGRPIAEKKIKFESVSRVFIDQANYSYRFGLSI